MNVFRSSHQNLIWRLSVTMLLSMCRGPLPFRSWILPQTISNRVDLFPAFSPLMSISLLRTHVHDFQVVPPLFRILFLILHTVSLNGPFPWPLPLHHPPALVCRQNYYELAPAPQHCRSSIYSMHSCHRRQQRSAWHHLDTTHESRKTARTPSRMPI